MDCGLAITCSKISETILEARFEKLLNALAKHVIERANMGRVFAVVEICASNLQDSDRDLQWICEFIRIRQFKVEDPNEVGCENVNDEPSWRIAISWSDAFKFSLDIYDEEPTLRV